MILCLTLGILSILYGIAILRAASGTMFFMVWFAAGACFILLGLAIRAGLIGLLPKAVKAILAGLIAAGLIIFCMTMVLIGKHFHDKGNDNLDYLIVLGAQVKVLSRDEAAVPMSSSVSDDAADGTGGSSIGPSLVLRYRLETAASYLHDNPETICVVSGGKSASEPAAEGDVMAEWLENHGIAAERIIIEDASSSTVENIRNSLGLIREDRQGIHPEENDSSGPAGSNDNASALTIGIVTNNFHVYRGTAIAQKECLNADKRSDPSDGRRQGLRAVGIAAPSNSFYLPNNMLRESMGIVKDFLKGNL